MTAGFWGVEPKVNKQHCAHSISDSTWLPFDIRQMSGLLSLILHVWLRKSSNHWKHRFLTQVLDILSVYSARFLRILLMIFQVTVRIESFQNRGGLGLAQKLQPILVRLCPHLKTSQSPLLYRKEMKRSNVCNKYHARKKGTESEWWRRVCGVALRRVSHE